jgi:hypothetical protein
VHGKMLWRSRIADMSASGGRGQGNANHNKTVLLL